MMQPPPPPGSAANPNAAPGYNIDGLLERFASTYRRLDNLTGAPKKRKERKEFDDIAKALCKSFADLADDQAFWSWLASIAQPDEQQVKVFLADLNGFESRQPRLFEGLGLDTLTSVQLTTGFTTSVEQYRGLIQGANSTLAQAVQDLVGYARQIRQAVCENPTLKNVSLGLSALAAVGSLAGGLAAAAGVVAARIGGSFRYPDRRREPVVGRACRADRR